MKVVNKLIEILKNIFFIPRNLAIITRQSNSIIKLENKSEAINQKLNELDIQSILQKLDTLSQKLWDGWDRDIEGDLANGRLDDLIANARADIAAGRTHPLNEILGN